MQRVRPSTTWRSSRNRRPRGTDPRQNRSESILARVRIAERCAATPALRVTPRSSLWARSSSSTGAYGNVGRLLRRPGPAVSKWVEAPSRHKQSVSRRWRYHTGRAAHRPCRSDIHLRPRPLWWRLRSTPGLLTSSRHRRFVVDLSPAPSDVCLGRTLDRFPEVPVRELVPENSQAEDHLGRSPRPDLSCPMTLSARLESQFRWLRHSQHPQISRDSCMLHRPLT